MGKILFPGSSVLLVLFMLLLSVCGSKAALKRNVIQREAKAFSVFESRLGALNEAEIAGVGGNIETD